MTRYLNAAVATVGAWAVGCIGLIVFYGPPPQQTGVVIGATALADVVCIVVVRALR